jgi:hypothetical protein
MDAFEEQMRKQAPPEATFRGKKSNVLAGDTLNIPANAPHQFHNASTSPVRLLCICSPAGQEKFFTEVGVPVATRTTPPPKLDEKEQAAFIPTGWPSPTVVCCRWKMATSLFNGRITRTKTETKR